MQYNYTSISRSYNKPQNPSFFIAVDYPKIELPWLIFFGGLFMSFSFISLWPFFIGGIR